MDKNRMIIRKNDADYVIAADGIRRKAMASGKQTLLTEFLLEGGKILPLHSHPHEQTGYLVSGHMIMVIEGAEYEMHPGDSWCIPGNAEHMAKVLEDCLVIEVFVPVREEYIPR